MRYQLRYVRVPPAIPATDANSNPPVAGPPNRYPVHRPYGPKIKSYERKIKPYERERTAVRRKEREVRTPAQDQDGASVRPVQPRRASCAAEMREASAPTDGIGWPVVRSMNAGRNSVLATVEPDRVTRITPVSF